MYKRQHLLKFQKYKRRQVITCVKCGGSNAALLYALRYVPVSYTHLDVYKRQVLQFVLLQDVGADTLFSFPFSAYFPRVKEEPDLAKEKPAEQTKVWLLPIEKITPSPFQARTVFDLSLIHISIRARMWWSFPATAAAT